MEAALACRDASAEQLALWFDVQQFLVREARLLDERRFGEWVGLFTDDVTYWMPIASNRTRQDLGREFTQPGELAHFEEDKKSLTNRVKRLATGMAWAETPPSRTRHFVTNVEVSNGPADHEVTARSNILVYRSHLEYDVEFFAGRREDVLRRVSGDWRIARRLVVLDQSVITQKSLGLFF